MNSNMIVMLSYLNIIYVTNVKENQKNIKNKMEIKMEQRNKTKIISKKQLHRRK